MAACTLDVGPRRVLVSEEGPPAAEFALFDASDIELAPAEDGTVREAGYRTTAANALRRLAVAGVTLDFARECAALVNGRVAETYARGPLVRRLCPLLGPAELFDGGTYEAVLRRYDGTWLDLPLLTNDAGIAGATGVLHAAALAALLNEVGSDTPVVLTTLGHAESLRLGERTLRRHAVDNVASVPRALRHLAELAPGPQSSGRGPGRDEFGGMVAARLAECVNHEAREHLVRLERALNERGRPSHGPLADGQMWEAERLLSRGDIGGALRQIEAREASRGREPATIYLRARIALLKGKESPRTIAQRVGEIALSMSEFPEIELLAAQAWNAAGETRNAIPFARDLVSNPRVPEDIRAAAEAILRAPRVPLEAGVGDRDFESSEGELQRVSRPTAPSIRAGAEHAERPSAAPGAPGASIRPPPARPSVTPSPLTRPLAERPSASPPAIRTLPESEPSPIARSVPPPQTPQIVVHDLRNELPFSRTPSEPPRPRTLTPPALPLPSPTPLPVKDARRYLTPPERMASPLPPRSVQPPATQTLSAGPRTPPEPWHPASARNASDGPPTPRSPGTGHSRPPPPSTAPAKPPSARPSGRIVQPEPWPSALRAPREERSRPEDVEHTPARSATQRYMRGASLPPVASIPPLSIPRAPVVPRVDIDEAELVETLLLPRGASDSAIEAHMVPRTPLEARIRFSTDARELARRYRLEDGIELRLEARALSAMQRRLSLHFPDRVVTTPDEAREAELHGALLSELLARLLDAEWTDISPSELGYWAMVVPSRGPSGAGGKRVWPFGRVLRFIASGGEDDLIAFFRKLRDIG